MKRVFLLPLLAALALAVRLVMILPLDEWSVWVLLLLLGAGLWWVYRATVRPVSAVVNGVELLKGQDFSSRLVKVGQPDADKVVDLFNTLMERIGQERRGKEEKNLFLDQIIEASPSGIFILDFDGNVVKVNPAGAALLGAGTEWKGQPFSGLSGGVAQAIAGVAQGESRTVRLPDNRILRVARLSFIDRGFTRPFVVVDTLTDEMHRAEKQAYEKVIRIIAHEVNNSMAGMQSLMQALAEELPPPSPYSEILESCRERCASMSAFITSYADVVKLPDPMLAPVDLQAFLRRQMPFLESIGAPHGIPVMLRGGSRDGGTVLLDEVLMGQVMVNLVKNAVESILSRDKRLTSKQFPAWVEIAVDGHTLTVTDNGPGIPPELSESLFTPFFSTKPSGQGIGLMCVAEILRRHTAAFSLTTSPSTNLTTFTIKYH